MIFLVIGFILGYIYRMFGRYYAYGMAEYAFFNNTPKSDKNRWTEPEDCLDSVKTEYGEYKDAMRNKEYYEAVKELLDVYHAVIKYISINYLPQWVYCNVWYWSIIFFLNVPIGIKLGGRFKKNGCIRNHKNVNNTNHTCNFKNKKNN